MTDESRKEANGDRHAERLLGERANDAFSEMGVPGAIGEQAGEAWAERGGELINDDCATTIDEIPHRGHRGHHDHHHEVRGQPGWQEGRREWGG
jgi:hypothetical protein